MEIRLLSPTPLAEQFFRRNLLAVPGVCTPGLYIAEAGCLAPLLPAGSLLLADPDAIVPQGGPTVTCGFSSKDTFTFSSKSEDSAVVSLMRTVALPQWAVEPMELPVAFPSGTADFFVLAAAAALILTGQAACREKICFR